MCHTGLLTACEQDQDHLTLELFNPCQIGCMYRFNNDTS